MSVLEYGKYLGLILAILMFIVNIILAFKLNI